MSWFKKTLSVLLVCALMFSVLSAVSFNAFGDTGDTFILYDGIKVAPIYVDDGGTEKTDFEQVARAVGDLKNDIKAVTGKEAAVTSDKRLLSSQSIIIGTVGHSDMIDTLAGEGKLDVSGISGEWEAFTIQLVDSPVTGVEKALVIAGSDKRGTIYGIYELSQMIGVSPWYWWGDVPIAQQDKVTLSKETVEKTEKPDVKYRGIFINDEENFTVWSGKFKNDTDSPGTPNADTYAKVFELMLRLKANVLWPAMHQQSAAFNAYVNPQTGVSYNAEMADTYGVIMGASHCEMLLRNSETEWEPWCEKNAVKYNIQKVNGNWKDGYDYTVNPLAMNAYWEERVASNYRFDNVYTLGLRAVHDAAINCKNLENPTPERKAGVVKQAVEAQVSILRKYEQKYKEETGEEKVFPKIFCPYKEAAEYFKYDLSLPQETIIVWADDNHGYVRAVSTEQQLDQYDGAGVYYHISYYDSDHPQSYLWVTSTPLPMIYDEMNKAYQAGSDDFWILNVGDIKPSEIPMEFFLEMGWDHDRYNDTNLSDFTNKIARRDFGLSEEDCAEVSDLIAQYYQISIAKRPEYQGAKMGSEYSMINYGDEAQIKNNEMIGLCGRSEKIYNKLPEKTKAAYYERVHYMIRAGRYSFEKSVYQQKNQLYLKQGRFASVNAYAKASHDAYNQILADLNYFNKQLSNGKWDGIINPYCTIQGLPTIPGPPSLSWVKKSDASEGIGSVCEGQETGNETVSLLFNSITDDKRFIDVFNKGLDDCNYTITADNMIKLTKSDGIALSGVSKGNKKEFSSKVSVEERIWASIDWSKVGNGKSTAEIIVSDAFGFSKTYRVDLTKSTVNPASEKNFGRTGYYETHGEVSIEAEHFSKNAAVGEQQWKVIEGRGRTGDAMKVFPDLSADAVRIDSNFETTSPYLEYNIYFETTGTYKGTFYRIPTLNEGDGKTCRTGISFNGGTVGLLRGNSLAGNTVWSSGVRNQVEKMDIPVTMNVSAPGWYSLRIYKSDAGMEFDKIVLYNTARGQTASHLGAPESYHTNAEYTVPSASVPPRFDAKKIVFPAGSEKYFYDFSADAQRASAGYTGVDNKVRKSEEKGYAWDSATFSTVKAATRTGASKTSVRDQGFVYGSTATSIQFILPQKGSYIVGIAIGDRQLSDGVSVNNMAVKANGKTVLSGIAVAPGQTVEKCHIADVAEDKVLNIELSGNNWAMTSLEIAPYNPAQADGNPGAFIADGQGNIYIETESALEQSDYAWSTKSTDGMNAEWMETYGVSGTAMFSGPNKGASYSSTDAAANAGPKLYYQVRFPEKGSYFVWAYIKSQCNDDDSLHVSLDSGTPITINDTNDTAGDFKWFNVGSINVDTSGKHTLSVWGREDGIVIDKLMVTKSAGSPFAAGGKVYREENADKTELAAKINEAETYLDGRYTKESLDALKAAIRDAETVMDNTSATAEMVTASCTALQSAIENLAAIPQVKKGDIDEDGKVTVSDVVKLRSVIMAGTHTENQLTAGDFDADQILSVTDVVSLRSYIMKGIPE